MAYHWMFDMSNTTDVTSGTCRNFLLFRSTRGGIGIAQFLVVGVVLCESLFIFPFFLSLIVLFFLIQFTASD
jgi:hypothetical protein